MARTITFDGPTGGLGRHLPRAITELGFRSKAIVSRLGDVPRAREEFRDAGGNAESIAFVQTAAMVSVTDCERDPNSAYETNVVNTIRTIGAFLDATEKLALDAALVYTSSAHIYARAEDHVRVRESSPIDPMSVYARSKLKAEEEVRRLVVDRGARAVIARVFGLLGPGQRSQYLLPALIARAKSEEVANIPGLDNVRDYLDARDIAFHLSFLADRAGGLEPGQVEVVNVCSGEEISIRELFDLVLRAVVRDISQYRRVSARITAAPGRTTDVRWLVGDPSHLLRVTGFDTPRRIPLGKTIEDAVGE